MDFFEAWFAQTVLVILLTMPVMFVSHLLGMSTVHVVASRRLVRLSCIDANAIERVWVLLLVGLPLVATLCKFDVGVVAAIAFVLLFSLRLEVRSRPGATWLIRKFLFVVPWYRKRYHEMPSVSLGGWDIDTLDLHIGPRTSDDLELGSGGRARIRELANQFNSAIEEQR